MLNYNDLKKNPRNFLSATGLTKEEFEILLVNFRMAYEIIYPPHYLTIEGKELNDSDKILNRIISSAQVLVEHVICGIKRCRIIKDQLRLTKVGISDLVMEIACGLHNLRVPVGAPLKALIYSILLALLKLDNV